jgi:hypothetical protein
MHKNQEDHTIPEKKGRDPIQVDFGALPDGTIISEANLADLFGKHPVSVKRAVERGELPPPTKLMGKPVWTAGSFRRHIEDQLERKAKERAQLEQRITKFRP